MNTALSFLGIMLLAGLVVGGQSSQPDCLGEFIGAWEYRQSAGGGFDAEGERLELSCREGVLTGLYHGLEREGEHGLFYTLVPVKHLYASPAGRLSFSVPDRKLFQQPPRNLEAVQGNRLPSSGFTRDELHFEGRLESSKLLLTCFSKASSCPERRMLFGRLAN